MKAWEKAVKELGNHALLSKVLAIGDQVQWRIIFRLQLRGFLHRYLFADNYSVCRMARLPWTCLTVLLAVHLAAALSSFNPNDAHGKEKAATNNKGNNF